jgi:uncharacterized membrane protein
MVWIDDRFDNQLIPQSYTGGPDTALAILSSIATSMVSLAALVLTITMVVVQLAMGQFSPRIVQPILKDRPSQLAIGVFVGTFAFAMLAMRAVIVSNTGGGQVPGLTVVTAFLLVVIAIAVLVVYVHHIGRSLRVSALIEIVGRDTRQSLDNVYEKPAGEPGQPHSNGCVISAPKSGVIAHVDCQRLVGNARDANCTLKLIPTLGEFVAAGTPLFHVEGDPARLPPDVDRAVVLGLERRLEQDVAYGLRLLVDIAERSLAESPFVDPTTAVQAIDRLHDCLRHLARRPFPDGIYRDESGSIRLVVPVMTWDAYVHLAYDEIRLAGAGSPQVARRLQASIQDLLHYAPPDRRNVLREQSRLLELSVRSQVPEHELPNYLSSDRQGLGPAAGPESPAPSTHKHRDGTAQPSGSRDLLG